MFLSYLNFSSFSPLTQSPSLLSICGSPCPGIGYCRGIVKLRVLNWRCLATAIWKLAWWKHLMLSGHPFTLECFLGLLNRVSSLIILKISCLLTLWRRFKLWDRLVWSMSYRRIPINWSCWKIKDPFGVCIDGWPLIRLLPLLFLHAWVLLPVVRPVSIIPGLICTHTVEFFNQRLLRHQCRLSCLSPVLTELFTWLSIRLAHYKGPISSHRPLLFTTVRWIDLTADALLPMCLTYRTGAKSFHWGWWQQVFIIVCALLLWGVVRQTSLVQISHISVGLSVR